MTVARNSQVVAEVVRTANPAVQVSQVAVDVIRAALATAFASQAVIEVVRANGDEVPIVTASSSRPLVMCVT